MITSANPGLLAPWPNIGPREATGGVYGLPGLKIWPFAVKMISLVEMDRNRINGAFHGLLDYEMEYVSVMESKWLDVFFSHIYIYYTSIFIYCRKPAEAWLSTFLTTRT